MTITVNIQEAKTNLSKLIREVQEGNEVVIAKRGKPVANLGPTKKTGKRKLGFMSKPNREWDDSFFDPLPEEDLQLWGL
jgi:prevent-host-death family protein